MIMIDNFLILLVNLCDCDGNGMQLVWWFLLLISGTEDNQAAFMAHFADEIALYQHVTAINLVDQFGKEKVIADTFLRHVLTFNCPGLTYVAFDFHEYW